MKLIFYYFLLLLIFDKSYAEIKHIANGHKYVCVANDTSVRCSGENLHGQLKNLDGFTHIKKLVAGRNNWCVIDVEGVGCYGDNSEGQLTSIMQLHDVEDIALGAGHACALNSKGQVLCYGNNVFEQIDVPTNLKNVKSIFAKGRRTCALNDVEVVCWGYYTSYIEKTPEIVKNPLFFSMYSSDLRCTLDSQKVVCWGEIAKEKTQKLPKDLDVKDIQSFHMINSNSVCVMLRSGAKCWDMNNGLPIDYPINDLNNAKILENYFDNLCTVSTKNKLTCSSSYLTQHVTLFPPSPPENTSKVIAADNKTCVIVKEELQCWGAKTRFTLNPPYSINNLEQLQLFVSPTPLLWGFVNFHCIIDSFKPRCFFTSSDYDNKTQEVEIPQGIEKVQSLWIYSKEVEGLYDQHVCVLQDMNIRCWSYDLGLNVQESNSPLPHTNKEISQVAAGSYHHCYTINGKVECIGSNFKTQCDVPKDLGKVINIDAGVYHTCAHDNTDTIKCWGDNSKGQLNAPSRIVDLVSFELGYFFGCLLDREGVKCWGDNSKGQLDVPELKRPHSLSVGSDHACVIDEGQIKCWGNNTYGQSTVPKTLDL